ncbi:MAG: glycosyl transferase family 2 [Candidatus Rokubacteria bacterium]|nr:glycosyl transferase family 2 [Candidatus Rokubacteria bacterium]
MTDDGVRHEPGPGPPGKHLLPHAVELGGEVEAALERLRPRDIAIALLTYNNAGTVKAIVEAAAAGVALLEGSTALVIDADAGSSDATREIIAAGGLPVVHVEHPAPLAERLTVPFHGVPGRGSALAVAFTAAHRVGARALVVLEADVTSLTPEWVARLARPVLEEKADFVSPAYARHRYEGTITNLLLAPLIRALYGRRLRQPFGGQQAFSARLVEHLLVHPRWGGWKREIADIWILGTAVADGFSVWEAWLGRRTVRSATRSTDLPTMVAQTLGGIFAVMHAHEDLWLEVRGSEPVPEVGAAERPGTDPARADVARMLDGFRRGVRDLLTVWEHVLAPETLGDVLGLDTVAADRFRFPNDLWARVVYDFALGYHYDVVHRDHLLRSLVPLYLGRTAAFVMEAEPRSAEGTEALLERVAEAFERQKPYLTERWR